MARAIQELAELLARLPGVGRRTATRLSFHLLRSSDDYTRALGERIATLHERVTRCAVCANISDTDPCHICADPGRNQKIVCVVESVPDLWAIDAGGTYRGAFHVLHGLLRPLDGIGPDDLNLELLRARASGGGVEEIIIATRPSVEGEATALMIRQAVADLRVAVTRIASGIPHGSELEYTDARTLERAIVDRREMR
jgi:recombination protein RecR